MNRYNIVLGKFDPDPKCTWCNGEGEEYHIGSNMCRKCFPWSGGSYDLFSIVLKAETYGIDSHGQETTPSKSEKRPFLQSWCAPNPGKYIPACPDDREDPSFVISTIHRFMNGLANSTWFPIF